MILRHCRLRHTSAKTAEWKQKHTMTVCAFLLWLPGWHCHIRIVSSSDISVMHVRLNERIMKVR